MRNQKVWDWRSYILEYAPDNPAYRHVLLTLSCYMNSSGGSCFPSIDELCRATAYAKPTVIKYLHQANEDGWIITSTHGFSGQGWKRNQYEANLPEDVVNQINRASEGGKPDEKGGKPDDEKAVKEVYSNTPNISLRDNSPEYIRAVDEIYPHIHKDGDPEAVYAVSKCLYEEIVNFDPSHKYAVNPPSFTSWWKDIDLAMRRDKRTEEQLLYCIKWVYRAKGKQPTFYRKIIQSGDNLRQHFDKIKTDILDAKEKSGGGKKQQAVETTIKGVDKIDFDD